MEMADKIIAQLGLQRHPEGGWYRETWRGPELGSPEVGGPNVSRPDGAIRASGTAILFLLRAGERSHWHRVDADEIWLWHAGAPLVLSMGETFARDHWLGPDVLGGENPQLVVP